MKKDSLNKKARSKTTRNNLITPHYFDRICRLPHFYIFSIAAAVKKLDGSVIVHGRCLHQRIRRRQAHMQISIALKRA